MSRHLDFVNLVACSFFSGAVTVAFVHGNLALGAVSAGGILVASINYLFSGR